MNIKIETRGEILLLTGLDRLSSINAQLFKELATVQLTPAQRFLDVDLTHASHIDSVGLGALIAVHKRATELQGRVRLLYPQPFVRQMLELLCVDHLFGIVAP